MNSRSKSYLLPVLLLLLVALRCQLASAEQTPEGESKPAAVGQDAVSFTTQIAPILVKNCLGCHSPDESNGEYQVTSYLTLMKAGENETPPITPGETQEEENELLRLISSSDEDERMPQEADPLPPDQITLIRTWIKQGAKFDGSDKAATLVSIIPRKEHPTPPEVYSTKLPITALAFHPKGKELAVSGYNEVTIWDPATGKLLRRIKNLPQRTYSLQYSSDGKLLAVAGGNPGELGEVNLVDMSTGEVFKNLVTLADVAFGVAFSPDNSKLAACAADRSIRIFDVSTGKEDVLIEDHADWVMQIAWSPDGQLLASASRDKTSKVFNVKGESQTTYPGHGDQVYGVTFALDGKQIYTAGRDKKIRLWKVEEGKTVATIGGFGDEIHQLKLSDKGVFACSADRTIRQFDPTSRKPIRIYKGHTDWVYAIDIHPDSNRLASGSFDGEVRVWDTESGELVTHFIAAPGFEQTQNQQATVP